MRNFKVWCVWNFMIFVTFVFGFWFNVPYMYWLSIAICIFNMLISGANNTIPVLSALAIDSNYPDVPRWLDGLFDLLMIMLMVVTNNYIPSLIYSLYLYLRCTSHQKVIEIQNGHIQLYS